jgi:hypothetical protein
VPDRKSIVQVKFRLRKDILRQLERSAKAYDRSVNAEIAHRLEQSFQQPDIIEAVREEISSGFAAGFAAGLKNAPQPATFKDDARRAGFKVDARMVAAFKHALKELDTDPDKPHEEDKP